MVAKLHSWWQKIQPHRVAIGVVIGLLVILALIIVGYQFDVTGFNVSSTIWTVKTPRGTTLVKVDEQQPAKTFWDWLQLAGIIAIPVVVGVGAARFTTKQRQTELQIAENQQREILLQGYLDKMSELLLEKRLRESTEDAEVRKIAYVRTLTVLPRLDPKRKRSVLHFLYRSGLINISRPVVSLDGADLQGADLSDADLEGTNLGGIDLLDSSTRNPDNLSPLETYLAGVSQLSGTALNIVRLNGVNLNNAYLVGTNLKGSHLFGANLNEAIIRGADLSDAYLIGASLQRADLSGTNLYRTNLTGADLSFADLRKAQVTSEHVLCQVPLPALNHTFAAI